jgi:hypothetical protein
MFDESTYVKSGILYKDLVFPPTKIYDLFILYNRSYTSQDTHLL